MTNAGGRVWNSEGETQMNATARDLLDADADLNETIVYQHHSDKNHHPAQVQARAGDPNPSSSSDAGGCDRATGPSEMPMNTPPAQGQGRYTYGSGARPLDGYTIKRAIGRGGFGEVYYATSDSGKEVALKLIIRNLEVESRGVVQCMNLKCPNLLTVFDLKTQPGGESFVIMEYVSGPSLANVLARYPQGMPVPEVRAWLKGLVEGVAYLHDHGIVHRDLKPANLFMEEGLVKIGDYGLAKLITPGNGTEHSESIGTCHYMAPEIASGKYHKPIDVYAMGVIIYEMLTGRVPFEGETVGEVLMKHLTARPDVSMLPEPYRSIVGRALAKDPNQRPPRAYDLLPPDDAPRSPGVRFIGDGKTATPLPEAGAGNGHGHGQPKDDVLRIEAEEPVFYIGPETRPPRRPIAQRVRSAVWRRPLPQPQPQPQRRPQPQPQPQPRAQPAAQARRPLPTPQPVAPPQPPPTPPPLPSSRVRVAELAGSMAWAAPAAAILSVFTAASFGVDPVARPEQTAFLFGTSLLATWGALVPSRVFEGRTLNPTVRRGIYLLIGVLVGLAAWVLNTWTGVGPLPTWNSAGSELISFTGPASDPNPLGYAAYFGLVFMLCGWAGMAVRDRSRRVRLIPAAKAALIAGLVGVLWPSPQPWGLAVVALTALVTQAVSPWSKQGADYARYAAKAARQRLRKVA